MFSGKPFLAGAAACAFLAGCSGLSQLSSRTESVPQSKARAAAQLPAARRAIFAYTGAQQDFTVPAGVTAVTVEAYGGVGPGLNGGGGYIRATIPVTPGESLAIFVGGNGAPGAKKPGKGGFNGGGGGGGVGGRNDRGSGGGGASDVRQGGNALTNRVVVAGGSGGPSGDGYSAGGAGGGLVGGTGSGWSENLGGLGGSQSAGGAGGPEGYGSTCPPGWPGSSGSLGTGGDGGSGGGGYPDCYKDVGGGGGGGGYYGGGGGGGSDGGDQSGAGGGGGGSSYAELRATHVTTKLGKSTGGKIIISWK